MISAYVHMLRGFKNCQYKYMQETLWGVIFKLRFEGL